MNSFKLGSWTIKPAQAIFVFLFALVPLFILFVVSCIHPTWFFFLTGLFLAGYNIWNAVEMENTYYGSSYTNKNLIRHSLLLLVNGIYGAPLIFVICKMGGIDAGLLLGILTGVVMFVTHLVTTLANLETIADWFSDGFEKD